MAKSLAQLRASKPQSLPTRVVLICLDQAILANVQRLETEKRDLLTETQRYKPEDDEQDGEPKRLAPRPANPRIAEIDVELAAEYDKMRESEGELLISAVSGGKWQLFKDANPAREGNQSDEAITYGFCDVSALLDSLATHVSMWNGELLDPKDWDEWLADLVAPADLRAICSTVVELHETRITVPKSRSVSSAPPMSATDSPSPSA